MIGEITPSNPTNILNLHLESRMLECGPEEAEIAYFGLSKELQEAFLRKQQPEDIEFQEAA